MKCTCEYSIPTKFRGSSELKANNKGTFASPIKFKGEGKVKPNNINLLTSPLSFESKGQISTKPIVDLVITQSFNSVGTFSPNILADYLLFSHIKGSGTIVSEADRIGGDFRNFDCYEKLYPDNNLIDEGVFTGQYHVHNEISTPLFDDSDAILVSGDSVHQFTLTDPAVSFRESYAVFRVSSTPAKQSIYDIKFNDPSGNLICKYEDIDFYGDHYFSTYSTKPEINNGAKNTWEDDYPIFPGSGYTFEFKTKATPIPGYFNDDFDDAFSFESSSYVPLLKISALEICNSGDFGWRREDFVPAYIGVREIGERLDRKIDIDYVLPYNFESPVCPETETTWYNKDNVTNEDLFGQKLLAQDIDNSYDIRYITHHQDSGKLNLKFGHKDPGYTFGFRGGEFTIGYNRDFKVGEIKKEKVVDEWFTVDQVYLKVRAKKAPGSADYTIDVVGWSDDKLLNVTPAVGGFLQNVSGVGEIPAISGWSESNHEAFSAETFSDLDEYIESTIVNSGAGDHYSLYLPVVNSETYQEYEIPLKIFPEDVDLGLAKTYQESSYFEHIFLDIYPIPSGASISNIELRVKYKPSNALTLNVVGGNIQRLEDGRSEGTLYPANRSENDSILNAGSGYNDLALINNIPQGYSVDETLKSNYARRWRGVAGISEGPFDPYQFDFSFAMTQFNHPFDLYYDLGNVVAGNPTVIKNVGLRFKNPVVTPGYNGHESLSWTTDYGQIADSFDTALFTDSAVSIDNIDISQGYSIFVRFAPPLNSAPTGSIISKAGTFDLTYNAGQVSCDFIDDSTSVTFPSGVVWPISALITYNENNNGLGTLYVKDEATNSILKHKTPPITANYNTNNFSLSSHNFIITDLAFGSYNSFGAKLIDGDIYEPDLKLQQQSAQQYLDSLSVHWWNPSDNSIDTYALPNYLNENTSDWDLGAFKFEQFTNHEFEAFTSRVGRDYITFSFKNDGAPYHSKVNSFPAIMNSGLSYHTQIENDFLRLNLSDTSDNFHSVCPRISKDLPRDYLFKDRAVVVESVIDYNQSGVIEWEDGKLGPKLIVSLYAKSKDRPELQLPNYGLVNRKIHYISPKTNWEKFNSIFDPESFFDESESWSIFPEDNRLTEFNHKYYADDLDSMFLQYDLSIPSGDAYSINLNLHSVNIKLEDSFVIPADNFDSLNIFSSGDQIAPGSLNLSTSALGLIDNDILMYTSGVSPDESINDVNFYSNGADLTTSSLDCVTLNQEFADTDLSLYTSGDFIVSSEMDLLLYNNQSAVDQSKFLSLYNFSYEDHGVKDHCNLFVYNSIKSRKGVLGDSLDIVSVSRAGLVNRDLDSAINLFTIAPTVFNENLNLFLFGSDNSKLREESRLTLRTACYPLVTMNGSGVQSISWDGNNSGKSTEEQDEYLFSVPSSEDIRGADTVGWGNCPSGTAIQPEIKTHDTVWQPESCVDAGVIRPKKIFEGEFYGTRKYTGLVPNAPYDITVVAKPGSTDPYQPPSKLEEWEYGNTDLINYNGFKISGQGTYTKVDKELLAISDPDYDIDDYKEAGTVYVYRRQPVASGDKSGFNLEQQLTLPSGFIGDWYYDRGGSVSFPGIGTIPEKQWNIGQEGRRFGSSIGLSDDAELIAVGAPGAKWTTRTFEEIETSDVNILLLTITNELDFTDEGEFSLYDVFRKLEESNFLYKYFADPAVNINTKIICCVPTGLFDNELQPSDHPDVIVKAIPRQVLNKPIDPNITAIQLSGIKEAFFEAYPYDSGVNNNNIPSFLGYYVDNSKSLGKGVVGPAVTQFSNFFKGYSFASGLKDFYDNPASGYTYEYIPDQGEGESWNLLTQGLIENLLDTGNLYNNGAYNLITSGVGLEYANEDAIEFNYPPESGGRVYIYKKEEEDWNLIQEIKHNDSAFNNFFGRAVDLSKDGSTLAVGSPYTQDSCLIYSYYDVENNRLYENIGNWLEFKNTNGDYQDLVNRYNELRATYTNPEAGRIVYSEMNSTDKFKSRSDFEYWGKNHIQPFKLKYSYGIKDLTSGFTGLFKEPMLNSSNPRLGFTTAVANDGSTVVFGSPTDSFGYNENAELFFKHDLYNGSGLTLPSRGTWASTLHSGAVRIFERGRNVIPTQNIIMEYNKFGNLSNTLNNTEYYDEYGVEQNKTLISKLSNYVKSNFATVSIPDEVHTLFIITPEVDSANDEVINEIKRWLSLGDRKLVLVGDDPLWEFDGAYAESNKIINKILEKLNSSMRLHNARSEYEALLENNGYEDGYSYNITSSYVPANSNPSSLNTNIKLNAYGVADIRLHAPDVTFTEWRDNKVLGNKKYGRCLDYNDKAMPPIAHGGDLRARFTEREVAAPNNKEPYVYWERNLPFEFFSGLPEVHPDRALELARSININKPGFAPRPVIVAAEYVENILNIPAVPAIYDLEPIVEKVTLTTNKDIFIFTQPLQDKAFEWSAESDNYTSLTLNKYSNFNEGNFYDPPELNNRDTILQANGRLHTEYEQSELRELVILDEDVNVLAKQNIGSSEVYLFSVLSSESQESMSDGDDENVEFYDNLVKSNGVSNIIQLGSWTGNTSFKDAYTNSQLSNLFKLYGHNLVENWSIDDIPASKNVLWIASPKGSPTKVQLDKIKNWLNQGNKKLVITYNTNTSINTLDLCNRLNLGIKPWYLPHTNKMAEMNYNYSSSVLNIEPNTRFTPIQVVGGESLLSVFGRVTDTKTTLSDSYEDLWKVETSVTHVEFPAIPGSGYRIFYDWVSDLPEESQAFNMYIDNVHVKTRDLAQDPQTCEALIDLNVDNLFNYSVTRKIESPGFGTAVNSNYVDVQIPHDSNKLDIYFYANYMSVPNSNIIPRTCKLLSLSGSLVPINKVTQVINTEVDEIVGYEEVLIQESKPARTVVMPATVRPILTDNTKYAVDGGCGGKLVDDGPVIIAEEPESFSSFAYGLERSKIVLIADSTLINGRFDHDSSVPIVSGVPKITNEEMLLNLNDFISSINSPVNDNDLYTYTGKIVNPDTSSKPIYELFTGSGFSGNKDDFANEKDFDPNLVVPHAYIETDINLAKKRVLNEFKSSFDYYNTTPTYSVEISGVVYNDSIISGNLISDYMMKFGSDIIESVSGYRGDLFGYAVDIHDNKIVVGAPYNAYTKLINFNSESQSGVADSLDIGPYGGAGSAFVFQKKDGQGWVLDNKFRPSGIKSHPNSDNFGSSVSIDGDLIAVGAPNHNDGVSYIDNKGEFIRKEFNNSFDLGERVSGVLSYELTYNGQQLTYNGEPLYYTASNIGAAFIFENQVIDWNSYDKDWVEFTKVSDQEKNLGKRVSISRFNRPDSDYVLSISSSTSGVYITDGILREQPNIQMEDSSYLFADIFGQNKNVDKVSIYIDDEKVMSSGLVYSDNHGQIFLEASGVDVRENSLIKHRPYLYSVYGHVAFGDPSDDNLQLFTLGSNFYDEDSINLFIQGPSSHTVYNTLNMTTKSANFTVPSGLNFVIDADQPTEIENSGLFIMTSGVGFIEPILNLRVRGK